MKDKIIKVLNEALSSELTSIKQHLIHSRILADWGFSKLSNEMKEDTLEEIKHAEDLVDRILYLKGKPLMDNNDRSTKIGSNIEEILRFDLKLEMDAVTILNDGISVAIQEKDYGSVELLKNILLDEEEHKSHLESYLSVIERVGVENFLGQQL